MPAPAPKRNLARAVPAYAQRLIHEPNHCLPAWLVPGDHSRHVLAGAGSSVATPVIGSDATAVTYKVPSGRIFSLRGISIITEFPAFVPGDGSFTFTLKVTESGGTRNVDFLAGLTMPLGDQIRPYPIGGRLEFDALDVLTGVVHNVSGAAGAPNFVTFLLWGHTYPESER